MTFPSVTSVERSAEALPLAIADARTLGAKPLGEAGEAADLEEAARQFEAIFIRQLLKSLEKSATTAAGGEEGSSNHVYGSMLVNAMSDAIVAAGGIGLAKDLVETLASGAGAGTE